MNQKKIIPSENLNNESFLQEDLTSYIYGNKNNMNNFPHSSFTKSKSEIYDEMSNISMSDFINPEKRVLLFSNLD